MSPRHETTEEKLAWLGSCARARSTPGRRRPSPASTSEASCWRASGSSCCCDPGSFVELDRFVRHREIEFGMRESRPWGDAVVTGYGDGLRAARCASSARTSRCSAARSREVVRREGLQGDGHGGRSRLPRDRDQRLGRRAHPGGRRLARRVCGDLLAQRAGVRCRPADLAGDGAVRGRSGLLARDDRLRADGRGLVVHVHHRARRGEDGHGRGGDASRSSAAQTRTRRGPASRTSSPPDERGMLEDARYCSRSCRRTTSRPRRTHRRPTRSTASRPSSTG